jgi:hypothetical protein
MKPMPMPSVPAALLLAALICAAPPARAGGHLPDPDKVQAQMQAAVARLQLTPQQQDQLRPIVQDHVAQLRALRDKYPPEASRESRRAMFHEARTLRDDYEAKVREVLTDEQEMEWAQMRREARERMHDEAKKHRTPQSDTASQQ